jgi:hypothetical protein
MLVTGAYMVPPTGFLEVVEHIRSRFTAEEQLCAEGRAVCPSGMNAAVCSAAIAALVNAEFLRWANERELVRRDVEVSPPNRRTA